MSERADLQLASQSPRRRELLQQIGVCFKVVAIDVPEMRTDDESPGDYVLRLAKAKAAAGYAQYPGIPTLGADTIVSCDREVLEKPRDEEDCVQMLRQLSARSHHVLTAVSLCDGDKQQTRLSSSEVEFRSISDDEIRRYWQTGEPCDKAGAYAIQGLGSVFVKNLRGSYSGVVGLPIEILFPLLTEFKIPVWSTQ